ncbi:Uncharacterised protein [Serratia rubidaea]|uniref:Uncharacterized protein n=1 Tax=Serratia rubidaea TaxID=61652 RepID=A0A4U9HE82_SERRU|nr:Uncharacterised protein [Serratia rubidaea]
MCPSNYPAGVSLRQRFLRQALATQYPLTLTDTSGQRVTLKQEPKRVVVQDGRDILTLALLDRADPFSAWWPGITC